MIGQNPEAGSSTLFVRGNRDKEFSFEDGGCCERTGDLMPKLRAKKQSRVSGQQLA